MTATKDNVPLSSTLVMTVLVTRISLPRKPCEARSSVLTSRRPSLARNAT
jgi:hypothetical protein